MRRQLVRVVAAVTSMVALAFLVPLALVVKDLAADRAITQAENNAETIARLLIVLGDDAISPSVGATVGEQILLEQNLSIITPDGTVVAGVPLVSGEAPDRALSGSAYRSEVEGGQAIYVPVVIQSGDIAVVRAFVPQEVLTAGVTVSWVILGSLGVLLVFLAVVVADRLGRSMVEPVRELSSTAIALGEGELDARVEPSGPAEIEEVGQALNHMATQIQRLIETERETAADIAHRLRTPLTALRLDVEALADGPETERLVEDLDELQRTVDFVITEARRPVRRDQGAGCDLAATVSDRIKFWQPLGEEQGRAITISIGADPMPVEIPAEDASVLVDALIENVFSHTDDGMAFDVTLVRRDRSAHLTVEDAGNGWPDGVTVVERGATPGHSTGLGLDIVRRTAASVGGSVVLAASKRLGGASIVVEIPMSSR